MFGLSRKVKPDARLGWTGRRQVHFIDRSVQRSLLVAMVVLETMLVALCTWQVYAHMNELIEANLYRIHLADAGPSRVQLMVEAFSILGAFVGANVIALVLAEGIWSWHENQIVSDLSALMTRTRRLDFSPDSEESRGHEVLSLALQWRERERHRLAAIRAEVDRIDRSYKAERGQSEFRIELETLNKLIWRPASLREPRPHESGPAAANR